VNVEGNLTKPKILAATHADFVLPALLTLAKWEFTPAMQGDLPRESPVDGQVNFFSLDNDSAGDVLKANGIAAPDGAAPAISPSPIIAVDPVWPIDMLLKGEGGSATVDFKVNETGAIVDAHVREASQPSVGAAMLASVVLWRFSPPRGDNGPVTVALMKSWAFFGIPTEPDANLLKDPVVRLVLALRKGEIGGAKGLDEKLAPLYRVSPNYPAALKTDGAPAGHAEIEFVIDRDGRARLPRIVSATREEFGWAAATAVAQWLFKQPRRGGEPVDVKVKIPFEFAAPAG
jgi:TonB family protein